MNIRTPAWLAILLLASIPVSQAAAPAAVGDRLVLADGWELQSSGKVHQAGAQISQPGFAADNWMHVTVPTTVVAAQVKLKLLPDPFFGMNLRHYPGMGYPIGSNFSNLPMPRNSPYAASWWYRNAFTLPATDRGKTIWLNFKGINYRANIWLNGKQIAKATEVAGAWRTYEFNVTDVAKVGAENVLAIQVTAPTETDLAITFVDWNPAPPDKNMGLWREVYVSTSGPVAVRYPAVVSHVDAALDATLLVTAQLKNGSKQPVHGTLKGTIGKIEFQQDVDLAPNESKDVVFDPARVPQLNLIKPRLWWPAQMGSPDLYPLSLQFLVNGAESDRQDTRFGIREVTSELNKDQRRVFAINGAKILIRGGGWATDMMMREDPQRLRDEFRYVQDMGLNTIRLEGKLETEDFYNLADERGILVMAGWCCCDFWEQWAKWKPQDHVIAKASLTDQIYRLRGHPSVVAWLNGSDNPPPPTVEKMYLEVEKQLRFPNPIVSSATAASTPVTGQSGVKMTGPYEYVAPRYWTEDKISSGNHCNPGGCGGAYGFNAETSPGPAVPPVESLRTMLPKEHLWPIDEWWNFHAGGNEFKNTQVYTTALSARYGKPTGLDDYATKAQLMNYEGIRAMFEAYSRSKYTSTGVIQWMLNNAWPSTIWHLYDYYLRPGGGYFGAKRAMEALHPLYSYDDHSVYVVNSRYLDVSGLKLTTKVYNLDASEKFSRDTALNAASDSTNKVLTLPDLQGLSGVYFLVLRLTDSSGQQVGSNFYWLSTKPEKLDWQKSNWYTTPTSEFADFSALNRLPKVALKVTSRHIRNDKESLTAVTLENASKSVAFFVRLKVTKGAGGDEILPVIWQDNYVSLLPGEKRDITASYRTADLGTARPEVEISGWNLQ
jgi:exo-1,4-beta-D-glucosaminidase